MGIKAVHVFHLEPSDDGTLVRSEESWDGLIVKLMKVYGRTSIHSAISSILAGLKREAEGTSGGSGVTDR
jgi:hypothetical protein